MRQLVGLLVNTYLNLQYILIVITENANAAFRMGDGFDETHCVVVFSCKNRMAGPDSAADSQEACLPPALADLHWAIHSPPLLSSALLQQTTGQTIDAATLTACCPANWPSEEDIAARLHSEGLEGELLGKRFEGLVRYWLLHQTRLELVAHSLTLATGRTLTEFDFLLRDRSCGLFLHLETACKYYLAAANTTSHSQWIGTNVSDRLDTKLAATRRQFSLFTQAKASLVPDWPPGTASCFMLKGYFFVPFRLLGKHCLPEGADTHCQAGWYLPVSDLPVFESSMVQWWIPPRARWMAPVRYAVSPEELRDGYEMARHLSRKIRHDGKARLVIQLEASQCGFREVSRGFVVPDSWPSPARNGV